MYLSDHVEFNSVGTQRRLRSTTTRAAVVRRTRTQFGRRAFAVCGPDIWDTLPPVISTIDSYHAFRRSLKQTYLILLLTSSYSFVFLSLTICNARSADFFVLLGTMTFIYNYDYDSDFLSRTETEGNYYEQRISVPLTSGRYRYISAADYHVDWATPNRRVHATTVHRHHCRNYQ